MSSGQYRRKHSFNDTVIKDGWIVRIRKDGTIKSKIEPWEPGKKKKK
jgi:hypothetical protein